MTKSFPLRLDEQRLIQVGQNRNIQPPVCSTDGGQSAGLRDASVAVSSDSLNALSLQFRADKLSWIMSEVANADEDWRFLPLDILSILVKYFADTPRVLFAYASMSPERRSCL